MGPRCSIPRPPLLVFIEAMVACQIRVLVVDDDSMSRELLCVLLEEEGYGVEGADCGESALLAIRRTEEKPDLVLTDLQMPGIRGNELARALREVCGPETALVAMSGTVVPDEAVSQFDRFLLKPFKVQEVRAFLEARRPRGISTNASPEVPAPQRHTASKLGMGSPVQEMQTSDIATVGGMYSPVLNETIYQQLASCMPAKQLHEMYSMCMNDARERIASMRRMADAHESASFVREAHAIKGSSGMLGASQIHGMAAELERGGLEIVQISASAKVNSLDELSAACDRLERMLGARV
jgi:CheY-like chemotaxis protein